MKKQKHQLFLVVFVFSFLFLASPIIALGIEGACSYHYGANCSIGSINGRAVCNDGWLSSVPYEDMAECMGYESSCISYINEPQYTSNKNAIKSEALSLKSEINKLKSDLSSLDYQELNAILELQQNAAGRGITAGGLQPQINAIQREYELKRVTLSQNLDALISQYNELVKRYNGLCRSYTYEEKNAVCVQNFGSDFKYAGGLCVAIPAPTSALQIETPSIPITPKPVPTEPVKINSPILETKQVQTSPVAPLPSKQQAKTPTISTTTQATTPPSQNENLPKPKSFFQKILSPFRYLWNKIFR